MYITTSINSKIVAIVNRVILRLLIFGWFVYFITQHSFSFTHYEATTEIILMTGVVKILYIMLHIYL